MSDTVQQNPDFNKYEDKMMQLVGMLQRKLDKVYDGGGKARLQKEHDKGKLSARERISFLLDKDGKVIAINPSKEDIEMHLKKSAP